MGTAEQEPVSIGVRFIALVLLAAGVQLWLNHHLGLSSQTPWLALVLGALSGALGLIARVLDEGERKGLAETARRALRILLNRGLLTWLWGVGIVASLFVSSVLVIPRDVGARGKATLRSAEGQVLGERDLSGGVARFVVFTSPFGRPHRLHVPGFLEETIAVYPLVGLKVAPERDLRRSPSVLFRPSHEAVRALRSQGTFTVVAKRSGGDEPVISSQQGHPGSFLIGRAQGIPPESVSLWRLELEGAGNSPALLAQMVLAWARPRVIEPSTPLSPGMTLVAEVRTQVGVTISRVQVTLGGESLSDVALVDE